MSNQRQIGIAYILYAGDWGRYPPHGFQPGIWDNWPGLVGKYLETGGGWPKVYICPTHKIENPTRILSYGINSFIAIKKPFAIGAATIILSETDFYQQCIYKEFVWVEERHEGKANYLISDGHVETMPALMDFTDPRWEYDPEWDISYN